MQDALKLFGTQIAEKGIQQRQEIKKQIYEERKNKLQYKRRRGRSFESDSAGPDQIALMELQQTPMRIESTLKKEYILNVDNSDAFNSIQSLEESYKGQINLIKKKVKQNKNNMEKDGIMFQPGQNIVSIDKGQVVQNRLMHTERPATHGWDGIKEVTDVSKDNSHDRGDDIDLIVLESKEAAQLLWFDGLKFDLQTWKVFSQMLKLDLIQLLQLFMQLNLSLISISRIEPNKET